MLLPYVRNIAGLLITLPSLVLCDPVNWEAMKNGIARVSVDGSVGAGVLSLAQPGKIQIVTSLHLLARSPTHTASVTFYWARTTLVAATVLDTYAGELDLAVLEVPTSALRNDVPSFGIRKNASLRLTERLYVADSNWTLVPVNVSRLDSGDDPTAPHDPRRLAYTQSATGVGFSGGPLFDQDGQLVGIHRGSFGGAASRLAVGIKVESAKLQLESLGIETPMWGISSILDGNWNIEIYENRNGTNVFGGTMAAQFHGSSVEISFPEQGALGGTFTFDGRTIRLKLTDMLNPYTKRPMDLPGGQDPGAMMQFAQMMGIDKFTRNDDGTYWSDVTAFGSRMRLVQERQAPQ